MLSGYLKRGGSMPDCPKVKSKEVERQLCDTFYPYGCGTRCKRLYEIWMKTEEEVRTLEMGVSDEMLRQLPKNV